MVLLESSNLVLLGSPAPDFKLKGVDGKFSCLEDFAGFEVLVIVFMCNHCPYVQAVWSRLVHLQAKYDVGSAGMPPVASSGRVRFVGINPNLHPDYPEEAIEKMREYHQRYQMNFPYLQDKDQSVARAYGAVCTPDIFVYTGAVAGSVASAENFCPNLAYHGRLDDSWRDESAVKVHDLDQAIMALLSGGEPLAEQFPSVGCSIKWV